MAGNFSVIEIDPSMRLCEPYGLRFYSNPPFNMGAVVPLGIHKDGKSFLRHGALYNGRRKQGAYEDK
jgi:hypothetical protein